MLEKIKRLGLTWKFGASVLAALAFVIIILLFILSSSLNSRLDALYGSPKTTSIFVAEMLADELAPLAKKNVNSLDVQQQIQQIVDAYYKSVQGIYNVHYLLVILVQDGKRVVLADNFLDIAPDWLVARNEIDGKSHCDVFKTQSDTRENVYYDCAIPLKMGDAGMGAVRAGVLQRHAEEAFAPKIKAEHVSKVFTPVLLVAILLVILVTAGLTFAFWFFVIRRILFLTELTEKMSYGELGEEVPRQSQDEIGGLEETLEAMRKNLRDAIERLRERLKRR